jgi:hypothetical protein
VTRRSIRASALLLGIASAGCASQTTMPDTQVRASGERLHDGGFGLGSGGFTSPDSADVPSLNTTPACEPRGFGLGSGGKIDCPPTVPTL